MTDIVTQGVERTAGSPSFPELASKLPAESDDMPDVVRQHIPDAIDHGDDERNIRAAMAEGRKRREENEIDDLHKRPITQLHYDSREHGDKSLREVVRDVSDFHRAQRPDVQSAIRDFGGEPSEVLSRAQDPAFVAQLRPDWSRVEIEEFCRTGVEPPTKIGIVNDAGKLIRPLPDDQPYTPYNAFAGRSELKRGVRQFRQAQAEQQQLLLNELAAAQELEQQAAAEQAAPQQQTAAAESAQTATAQQSDPLIAERQQLAVERDAYVRARDGSAAEERAAAQIKAWQDALLRQFPEVGNRDAVEELTRTNPARAQQLTHATQKTSEAINGWMRAGAQATLERERAVHDLAVIQHAQARAAWHQYKDAEDSKVSQFAPELSDPLKASALRQGVRTMLNDIGFGNDELNAAWDGQRGFSVRDARAQRLILDAYRWRQAQAKAKNVTKAPVPPVMRPGVARPRGGGDLEAVARLERELRTASGDRAVKLATKLHQARRSAGM